MGGGGGRNDPLTRQRRTIASSYTKLCKIRLLFPSSSPFPNFETISDRGSIKIFSFSLFIESGTVYDLWNTLPHNNYMPLVARSNNSLFAFLLFHGVAVCQEEKKSADQRNNKCAVE